MSVSYIFGEIKRCYESARLGYHNYYGMLREFRTRSICKEHSFKYECIREMIDEYYQYSQYISRSLPEDVLLEAMEIKEDLENKIRTELSFVFEPRREYYIKWLQRFEITKEKLLKGFVNDFANEVGKMNAKPSSLLTLFESKVPEGLKLLIFYYEKDNKMIYHVIDSQNLLENSQYCSEDLYDYVVSKNPLLVCEDLAPKITIFSDFPEDLEIPLHLEAISVYYIDCGSTRVYSYHPYFEDLGKDD